MGLERDKGTPERARDDPERKSPQTSRHGSAGSPPLLPDDLDPILDKLKLLEFGLYGLQQCRRSTGTEDEDIGPFYRLAEEIGSDVLELQRRLADSPAPAQDG
ncbi:MAG TPA: hypothetical protein VLH58_08705 [Candidatus Methylomirabilis sp.]|nr:hypothetical protein [Candidatus Methylomirabilis sp.]HSC71419.1 hypothetical protein [Candidatus Methylomirabilis sp.]